jgi:hypothetical protein
MGKIANGKVKLRLIILSDTDLSWCGGHSTAPRRQRVLVTVGQVGEGSFLDVDDSTLLEMDLADNAVGHRVTTVRNPDDEWAARNQRRTITSEVRVTALPPAGQ